MTVRTRYLAEGEALRAAGASYVVFEEGETGLALAKHVIERRGVDSSTVSKLLAAIRTTWKMDVGAVKPQANAVSGVANS